jgi:DNA replication and repair protein RecF
MSAPHQKLWEGLRLYQFKKHAEIEIPIGKSFNCWLGQNGCGKTNALDALYYLCMTKSYFHHTDQYTITQGKEECSIKAFGQENELPFEILLTLRKPGKKNIEINGKSIERLSGHIGWQPVVVIAPQDNILITEGAEERRRWWDAAISQTQPAYMQQLMQYNHLLLQRNAYLKNLQGRSIDPEALSLYDEMMAPLSIEIGMARKFFLESFQPLFQNISQYITESNDAVDLQWTSDTFDQNPIALWKERLDRDRLAERTTAGPHRDDLEFLLNDMPIKKMGSQGQQKSYLIALKLAQMMFTQNITQSHVVLLLDDIHDKLDGARLKRLFQWLKENMKGQVVITDTDPIRIPNMLREMSVEPHCHIFES